MLHDPEGCAVVSLNNLPSPRANHVLKSSWPKRQTAVPWRSSSEGIRSSTATAAMHALCSAEIIFNDTRSTTACACQVQGLRLHAPFPGLKSVLQFRDTALLFASLSVTHKATAVLTYACQLTAPPPLSAGCCWRGSASPKAHGKIHMQGPFAAQIQKKLTCKIFLLSPTLSCSATLRVCKTCKRNDCC